MDNQEWVFLSRPAASGMALTDWELRDCAMPNLKDGEMLLASHMLSVDPTMRNAMAGPGAVALTEQTDVGYYDMMDWAVGSTPTWSMVAVVVDPNGAEGFAVGDKVNTGAPWRKYNALDARMCRKLDPAVPTEAYLGTLGGTGNAGYLPVVHIGQPKEGEIAFVSGAAGATGLVACQSLKLLGCSTVVGSAGSDDKVALLESLGIVAFNYKTEDTLDALSRLCPTGVDIYFDNVGGPTLEAALEVMNDFGRVIACGQISQYDLPPEEKYGVRNLFHVVAKRLTFQGYVTDPRSFTPEQFGDAAQTLSGWLASGELKDQSTIMEGFDQIPNAILGLFSGANTGKMIVRAAVETGAKL